MWTISLCLVFVEQNNKLYMYLSSLEEKDIITLQHASCIQFMLLLGLYAVVCLYAGFNVETLSYNKVTFTSWDVGGRCMIVSYFRILFIIMQVSM